MRNRESKPAIMELQESWENLLTWKKEDVEEIGEISKHYVSNLMISSTNNLAK